MSKVNLKIGDKVKLSYEVYCDCGCSNVPKDIRDSIYAKIHTVIEVKDTTKNLGTTGQWVKTDMHPEWVDKVFYKIYV